jgi:acyl-CoA hydrolase
MKIQEFSTYRLIKGEDLNHHGTLFAGRGAEWFVESGFIAASSLLNPRNLICVKIHGMSFTAPARAGETVCYTSKVVLAGTSSLVAHIHVTKTNLSEVLVSGFITFVHVTEHTRPCPHNIIMEAEREEDIRLQEEARLLKK